MVLKMKAIDTLFVYGPRRSGTNYLNYLLLYNTDYLIASLDKSPSLLSKSNARILTVNHVFGSKHDLDDVDHVFKFPVTGFYFFIFRPIEDWIFSRINYQKRFSAIGVAEIPDFARMVIHKEYFDFLSSLRKKIELNLFNDRFLIINYKTLSPENLLVRLNNKRLSCCSESIDCLRETAPGGGLGGAYVRERNVPPSSENRYISNVTSSEFLKLDLLDRVFYDSIFDDRLNEVSLA